MQTVGYTIQFECRCIEVGYRKRNQIKKSVFFCHLNHNRTHQIYSLNEEREIECKHGVHHVNLSPIH